MSILWQKCASCAFGVILYFTIVFLFVEKKNTDCIDDNVEDSLLTRVIRGHTNTKEVLVKMLLKAGADPNIAVKGDDSPLLHAVRTRNIEIIKILLESGADVKHVGLNSYTALHVYFQHDGEDSK